METDNQVEPMDDEVAVRGLIAQLRGDDYYPSGKHIQVFMAFSELKARGVSIVPALIDVLKDAPDEIRARAIFLLGIIGDESVVEPLIHLLRESQNREVRWLAVQALGALKDRRAVETLIEKLRHDDDSLRLAVVEALRNIGDQRAVEPLLLALRDPFAEVRSYAVEALLVLGDRRAIEQLMDVLEDEYEDVRYNATNALVWFGDERALPAIIRVVQQDSGYSEHYGSVRDIAARAIEEIKQHSA